MQLKLKIFSKRKRKPFNSCHAQKLSSSLSGANSKNSNNERSDDYYRDVTTSADSRLQSSILSDEEHLDYYKLSNPFGVKQKHRYQRALRRISQLIRINTVNKQPQQHSNFDNALQHLTCSHAVKPSAQARVMIQNGAIQLRYVEKWPRSKPRSVLNYREKLIADSKTVRQNIENVQMLRQRRPKAVCLQRSSYYLLPYSKMLPAKQRLLNFYKTKASTLDLQLEMSEPLRYTTPPLEFNKCDEMHDAERVTTQALYQEIKKQKAKIFFERYKRRMMWSYFTANGEK